MVACTVRSTFVIAAWLFVELFIPLRAAAQADSAATPAKPKENYGHFLRFGLELSKPVISQVQKTQRSYEAIVDYYLKKEVYAVLEGGFGSANHEFADLNYKTTNTFIRLGIDRTLIKRVGLGDWDAAFIGARYGIGFINRNEAVYTIVDSVWGSTSGTVPAKSFTAHWAEITGGVRVETLPNLFLGWNVRGRFLLNDRAFSELSPAFIAGFGSGDKTTVFDFNFYLCYAFRWNSPKSGLEDH